MSQLVLQVAIAVLGVVGTVLGSLLVFLLKSYFGKIREALETIEKRAKERNKEIDKVLDKTNERLKSLEISSSNIDIGMRQLVKDVARVEGGLDVMQRGQSEVVSKVERSIGRIDAAFRFIDGANRRASDG